MGRPQRKTVLVGGGIIGGLVALVAGITQMRKKSRYITGLAKLANLTEQMGGFWVVMDDGESFWAPANIGGVLKTFLGDGAPLMPYRIDKKGNAPVEGMRVGTVDMTS